MNETADETFDADIESISVGENVDELETTFSAERDEYSLVVAGDVDGEPLDGSDLERIFDDAGDVSTTDEGEIVLENVTDGSTELDIGELDRGLYEFRFTVRETSATDREFVEVTEPTPTDRRIESVTAEAGDVVPLTVVLKNTDRAAVQVGDWSSIRYEAGFEIDATETVEEELVVEMNTHAAGNHSTVDTDPDDVFEPVNDDVDVDVVYEKTPAEVPTTPLGSAIFALRVGDRFDGEDLERPNDIATLNLTDRTLPGDVSVYTAPADDDSTALTTVNTTDELATHDDVTVTETETVAVGDTILIGIHDAGFAGRLPRSSSDRVALEEAGISIELERAHPIEPTVWNSTDDDAPLDVTIRNREGYDGELLLLELSSADRSDDTELDTGEYTLTMTAEGDWTTGQETDRIVRETEFEIAERTLQWEADPVLVSRNGTTVTGETTLAPGTELETTARGVPAIVTETVSVNGSDVRTERSFAVPVDVTDGDVEVGDEFELVATDPIDRDRDSVVDAKLVKAEPTGDTAANSSTADSGPTTDDTLSVTIDAPDELELGETGALEIRVDNDGTHVAEPTIGINFSVPAITNGISDQERDLWIDGNDSWSESYELYATEAGTLTVTVSVDGDTRTDTVAISDDGTKPKTASTDVDDDPVSETDPTDDDGTTAGSASESTDATPGFSLASSILSAAIVALIGWHRSAVGS